MMGQDKQSLKRKHIDFKAIEDENHHSLRSNESKTGTNDTEKSDSEIINFKDNSPQRNDNDVLMVLWNPIMTSQLITDEQSEENKIDFEGIGEKYYQSLIQYSFQVLFEEFVENEFDHFELKVTAPLEEQFQQQNDEYFELLSPEINIRENLLLPPGRDHFFFKFDDDYVYDNDSIKFLENIFNILEKQNLKNENEGPKKATDQTHLKESSLDLLTNLQKVEEYEAKTPETKNKTVVNRRMLSIFYSPERKRPVNIDNSRKIFSVPLKRSSESHFLRDRKVQLSSVKNQAKPKQNRLTTCFPSRTSLKRQISDISYLSVVKNELILMKYPMMRISSTPPSQKNKVLIYSDDFYCLVTPFNTPLKTVQVPKYMEDGNLCFFRKKSFVNLKK